MPLLKEELQSQLRSQHLRRNPNCVTEKNITTMKYTKPDFEIFEVAVDKGYGDSVLLPGFGTENDELIY